MPDVMDRRPELGYIGAVVTAQLAILASLPFVTRLVSPAEVGVWQYWLVLLGVTGSVAALRYDILVHSGRSRRDRREAALRGCTAAVVVGPLLAIVLTPLIPGSVPLWFGVAALAFATVATAEFAILNAVRLAARDYRGAAAATGAQGAVTAMAQILLGALASARGLMAAVVLGRFVGMLRSLPTGLRPWSTRGRRGAVTPGRVVPSLRKAPWAVVIATLIAQAVLSTPLLILGGRLTAVELGFAALGWRIVILPMSLAGQALAQVVTAEIGAAHRSARAVTVIVGRRLALLAGLSGIVAAVLVTLVHIGMGTFLGTGWDRLGVFILCWLPFGLMQIVASPISQIPAVLGHRSVQLGIDVMRMALVALAATVCVVLTLVPLAAILLLAVAAGIGYLLQVIVIVLVCLRADRNRGL